MSLFQGKSELSPVTGFDSDVSDSEQTRKDPAQKPAGRTKTSGSKKSSGPSVGTSRKRAAPASPPKGSEAKSKKARKGKAREIPQLSAPVNNTTSDSTAVRDNPSIKVSHSTIIPDTSPRPAQSRLPSPSTQPPSSPAISSPQSSSPSYSSLFGGQDATSEGDVWNDSDAKHLVQVMERDHSFKKGPSSEDAEEFNFQDIRFSSPFLDPPSCPSSPQRNPSSSPPSQELLLPKTKASVNPGVRARQPTRQLRMENASSSSHHSQTVEEIGGTPLIPSAMGRFKSIPVKRGKGKQRE